MRVGHFILAALIALLLISGFFFNALDDHSRFKWWLREGHQSLGVLSIVLLSAYCVYALQKLKRNPLSLALAGRIVMLFVALSVAVSGYLLSMPYGVAMFSMPMPVVYEQFYLAGLALQWHFFMPSILLLMVCLHGALGIHTLLKKTH